MASISCDDLLAAMVRFDTVNAAISGRPAPEAPLTEHLESLALAAGMDVRRLPVAGGGDNLLIQLATIRDAPWLLFESHLDVVDVANMSIAPFAAEIRDGRLHGRGSCDTKASGAAMFCALQACAARGDRANNVALLFTVDEEIGKTGVQSFVDNDLEHLPWQPAGAIVGEPTKLGAIVAHNGVARWKIVTRGVAAHSSDPGQGKSAILMMMQVIDAIETRYTPGITASHPLTGKAQCSINVIRGGTQINIIPDHCEIEIDRRVVPGEDPATVMPLVQKLLDELCLEFPALSVEQHRLMLDPPLCPEGFEAFHDGVYAGLRRQGLPDEPQGAMFGTDASILAAAGVPAVVLGPGDIAQAHTHDEWVDLDQVRRAAELYEELMCAPLE